MTEEKRRDYARGYEAIGAGGEVSAALVMAASRLVQRAMPFVFGQDQITRDRWKWDGRAQGVAVPAREDEVEEATPMRTGAAEPDQPRQSGGSAGGGGDLAALPDDELDQLIVVAAT